MAVDNFFEGGALKRKRGIGSAARNKQLINGEGSRRANRKARGGQANTRVSSRGGFTARGRAREEAASSRKNDEELGGSGSDSGESIDGNGNGNGNGMVDGDDFNSEEEEDAKETPAQKRLRLAKMYLDSLKKAKGTTTLCSSSYCKSLSNRFV